MSDLTAFYTQEITSIQSRTLVKWDAAYEDDTNDVLFADHGAMPCYYDQATWTAASQRETAAQPSPVIFNGLNLGILNNNADASAAGLAMASVPNVVGGQTEDCYTENGGYGMGSGDQNLPTRWWTKYEQLEIDMLGTGKLFWCYGNAKTTAQYAQFYRTYQFASFMLTYLLGQSIIQAREATPSNFNVMPEWGLVALEPVGSRPTNISQLKTTTDVYAREYGACFYRRVAVGPCAMVVNPDTVSHPYSFGTKYGHTGLMVGGGVMEGGTFSVKGPAPSQTIGPTSAYIVFQ